MSATIVQTGEDFETSISSLPPALNVNQIQLFLHKEKIKVLYEERCYLFRWRDDKRGLLYDYSYWIDYVRSR